MQVIYSDMKPSSSFLGWEWSKEGRQWGIAKEYAETLGDNVYMHYLNCGDGFMSMSVCQNLTNFIL